MSRSSHRLSVGGRSGGVDPSFSLSKSKFRVDDVDDRQDDRWLADNGDPTEFDRPLPSDPLNPQLRRSPRPSISSVDPKKRKGGKKAAKRSSSNLLSAEDPNPVIGLEGAPLLLFSCSHDETLSLSSLKVLTSHLQSSLRLTSSSEVLDSRRLMGIRLLVLAGSRKPFTGPELSAVEEFLQSGGSVLILTGEGRYDKSDLTDDYTHLNALTSPYGISIESDSVARTVYAKGFYHPKEVLIRNASLSSHLDSFIATVPRHMGGGGGDEEDWEGDLEGSGKLSVVYPYGCTLSLQPPAIPLLTSGPLSFPSHRALAAYTRVGGGQLVVLGSFHCFDDLYLPRQHNLVLLTALIDLLTAHNSSLLLTDRIDPDRAEYSDPTPLPHTAALADRLRSCLQEPEDLPVDFTSLFDPTLFSFDTKLIPESISLYDQLQVKHQPLSLIPPQFDVPLPPFLPAMFHPAMRDLPPPPLELYDLDEHFSSPEVRLAQLTNKATGRDLELFIKEAAGILGIGGEVKGGEGGGGVGVLQFVIQKLIGWKKVDMEEVGSGRRKWGSGGGVSDVLHLEGMMGNGIGGLDGEGGGGNSTSASVGSTSRKAGRKDSIEME